MGSSASKVAKPLPKLSGKPIGSMLMPTAKFERPPPQVSESKSEGKFLFLSFTIELILY